MSYSTFTIKVNDGMNIHAHKWLPNDKKPTKVMFLIHGAVEHGKRYNAFANQLNNIGIVVIAPDLRGHGLTAIENGVFSHLGDKNGFLSIIQDLNEILDFIKKEYSDLPYAIFGHSFGSFLARQFISLRGQDFKGAIISATSWGNNLEIYGGLILSKTWSLFTNKNKPNQFYNDFLWATLNSKIKGRKGKLDFISSDEEEVVKYEQDRLNGRTISIAFGEQMSKALLLVRKDEVFKKTPNNLKIYLASGIEDPLSNKGKDLRKIAEKYNAFNNKNVTLQLNENARHELLNEVNKEVVIQDMIQWLNENI